MNGWGGIERVRRVAALYDVHGNLPALEAVLREVDAAKVDVVVVGGDVFPGPMSGAALTALLARDESVRFILGNGDRMVLELAAGAQTDPVPEPHRGALAWEASTLDPDHRRLMTEWPATLRVEIEGLGRVLFCHATPTSDTDVFTRLTPGDRLAALFEATGADVVVCGHTHMPFDRMIGRVRVVNAGSVGMPFCGPGGDWVRLGPGVEPRHIDYDLTAAAARVRASAYPLAVEFAERHVLEPPSEADTLARLAAVEMR